MWRCELVGQVWTGCELVCVYGKLVLNYWSVAFKSHRPDSIGNDCQRLVVLRQVCLVLSKGCVGCRFILVQKLIVFNALCILDTDDFHTSTPCVLVISSWPSSTALFQFPVDLASEQAFSKGVDYFHSLLNLAICLTYFASVPCVLLQRERFHSSLEFLTLCATYVPNF